MSSSIVETEAPSEPGSVWYPPGGLLIWSLVLMELDTVQIDVCEEHGVWLDVGELGRVIQRAKARGYEFAGETYEPAIEEARRDGKLSGALLGFWSLLLK